MCASWSATGSELCRSRSDGPDLRPVYTAPTEQAAAARFEEFTAIAITFAGRIIPTNSS
jgi:hypothetical protein